MIGRRRWLLCSLLLLPVRASAAPPASVDPRLVVQLVAAEPDIVTPTGLAVDGRGRIWAIENHTHQRPEKYAGPPTDRIRVFDDFGPDGRARKITTFAEGFTNSMGLYLARDGTVYLATRSAIHRLRDTRGTGQADERQVIVRLETSATYPHNGLSGFACDALGDLYFGLGENFGADYRLVGSDGGTLTGGGEGGSVYRCHPDGSGLTRLATGFWNPFHMAYDAYGRLFVVDNDPDSRGPCRLLHIVPGGDYGYRFRYGRKGVHPFQAWNGELPGTLPMVAGTAEAPSGIVAYESDGLPPEYRGRLLVTSWGDHVVEQFQPVPRGASFTAEACTLLRGGEDFRPVGIAIAPDGSLVLSDWVDKSYPVHGKGRVWRVRWKDAPPATGTVPVADSPLPELRELLRHPMRDVRLAAGEALAKRGGAGLNALEEVFQQDGDVRARLHALWALARRPAKDRPDLLTALRDKSAEARAEAIGLLDRLENPDRASERERVLARLARSDSSPLVRMNALLHLRTPSLLEPFVSHLADPDPFQLHAALVALGRPGLSAPLLSRLPTADARLRVGILLALRRSGEPTGREALPKFLADGDPAVRRAAIQWVAEEHLRDYAPLLSQAAARAPVQREVFEALLAAQDLLTERTRPRDPNHEPSGEAFVAAVVLDAKQPAALRAVALRMLRPDHPSLSGEKLGRLYEASGSGGGSLQTEAMRSLALRADVASQHVLRKLAADEATPMHFRQEAVSGLAHSAPHTEATRRLLLHQLAVPELRRDALRSLRDAVGPAEEKTLLSWWKGLPVDPNLTTPGRDELAEQLRFLVPSAGLPAVDRPASSDAWKDWLRKGRGDAAAGERLFFHPRGPRCYACHRVDGRGEAIGPDLSRVGAALSRDKLIDSILEPSKEIAPAFTTWIIVTRDGKTRTGLIVDVGFDSTLTLADAQGKREVIQRLDVEERVASPVSIMPADLHTRMTRQEFQDLLAFLESRR
jgi:putative membrane-bound dehydrogenase-like protein